MKFLTHPVQQLFYRDTHPELPESWRRGIDRLYPKWAAGTEGAVFNQGGDYIGFAAKEPLPFVSGSISCLEIQFPGLSVLFPAQDADEFIQMIAQADMTKVCDTDRRISFYLISPRLIDLVSLPVIGKEREQR